MNERRIGLVNIEIWMAQRFFTHWCLIWTLLVCFSVDRKSLQLSSRKTFNSWTVDASKVLMYSELFFGGLFIDKVNVKSKEFWLKTKVCNTSEWIVCEDAVTNGGLWAFFQPNYIMWQWLNSFGLYSACFIPWYLNVIYSKLTDDFFFLLSVHFSGCERVFDDR